MKNENNENFGRDDRNFHPEEQQINWETMSNTDPAFNEPQQFGSDTRNDYYNDQTDRNDTKEPNVKEQPLQPELDKDIDEELDKELEKFSDDEFDKKDTSDS